MKIILGIILCGFIFLTAGCASYGHIRINRLTAKEKYRLGVRVDKLEGLVPIENTAKPILRNEKRGVILASIPFKLIKPAKTKKVIIKENISGGKAVVKMQKSVAITGNQSVLPVVAVDYVKKPMWYIFKSLNQKTGYVFLSKGINLDGKKTFRGNYNIALILRLMGIKNAKINPYKKEIYIWR